MNWIKQQKPFRVSGKLVSISSSVVKDRTVTLLHLMILLRKPASMATLMGKTFHEVIIYRKARVLPLAFITSSVTVRGKFVPINVQQLFNRTIWLLSLQKDKSCFKYELTPIPTALFNESSTRK